jgi:hypothetical protein
VLSSVALPTVNLDVPVLVQIEPWVRSALAGVGAVVSWLWWHAAGVRT